MELKNPIDRHSRKLICRNIELLLDYCMRFYERQFVTRKAANLDILEKFERLLNTYFSGDKAMREGLPSVKYFAEECFLSPNYFGDLIKKETGKSPQEYIQAKIIAASIRNNLHVFASAMAGADFATIPFNVLEGLFSHSLTDKGIARFLADWEAYQKQ